MVKYNLKSGIGHRASGIGHRASGIGHFVNFFIFNFDITAKRFIFSVTFLF
ncbi:hypothetical protein [Gilliamella sp. Nev5-1]|uniref:hypothetical protein n=1 Tax=Gilliamella sp. Nev5-1 TaxID=3120251 RepID=UPI000AC85950|nr:hypothetical protein [Gilliamella apicola]